MTAPNAYECPDLYFDLGIELSRLGIVMLDVKPIHGIKEAVAASGCVPYISPDPESYVDGIVGDRTAHVTLLQGLLLKGDPTLPKQVLHDWRPEPLLITHIEVFEFNDYACVVAAVEATENLLEAHARLSLLPHIDLFPSYKPHITLAFVQGNAAQLKDLTQRFQYLVGTTLVAKHINYGH